MNRKKILKTAGLLLGICMACNPVRKTTVPVTASGFVAPVYTQLPLGSIQPEGWLRHQLQIMRNGTSGHLDEMYDKLKIDNGWLGGSGDGWEETPYWLDGALPLAWLLNDSALKAKVMKYVNWTIDHQRPSGYFGPLSPAEKQEGISITPENAGKGEDWWPRMVMLKVLRQYFLASGDKRAVNCMSRYCHYQLAALKKTPLGKWTEWAEARGQENLLTIQWLYTITNDPALLELAGLVNSQAFPWSKWFSGDEWIINTTTYRNAVHLMNRHAVNVAMALKEPALNFQRTGDSSFLIAAKKGWTNIMKVHGLPMGIFSADEDLDGNDPVQGAELCAIVEAMFSLEQMAAISGDLFYIDALEKAAFNALPTQTSDDYNSKQYFQIANQVQVSKGVFSFSLPFEREMCNVFGMRSGYTCCLANMHQGFTKFAAQLWYRTAGNGLASLSYAPNTVTAEVGKNNIPVTIRESTDYPFNEQINFRLNTAKSVRFPWHLRIPAWCDTAIVSLNGRVYKKAPAGEKLIIDRQWENNDLLELQLPATINTSTWGRNSRVVGRGPLVYALSLGEQWKKDNDEVEGPYYSIFTADKWNYGLLKKAVDAPATGMQLKRIQPVSDNFTWNRQNAPLAISLPAKLIPGWQLLNGVAYQPVSDRTGIYRGPVANKSDTVLLIPYGCTKVRVVAFPIVQ